MKLVTLDMNRTDINRYLTNPELVANASSEELRRLVETYPYCETLHWIYLRALYVADDAMFEEELMLHGMHISNRRLFYNYLTAETQYIASQKTNNALQVETQYIASLPTTDYFALDDNPEQKQTLQQLAAQLKAARLARQANKQDETRDARQETRDGRWEMSDLSNRSDGSDLSNNSQLLPLTTQHSNEITEEYAKKLIKEQKYLEAIEILRAISLNNPKKSANFALQIKFLETIINNHNKN
ncbi:MAG: hypothetical protein IJY67_00770 [Paludibacteraceae bacterium]|nr:hypothetical protein [Paludibacteraceae bacterium]